MKKRILPLLLAVLLMSGCSKQHTAVTPTFASQAPTAASLTSEGLFSSRDLESDVDLSQAVRIRLSGATAESSGSGMEVSGSTVTIREAGVYVLSGKLSDGQLVVDAGKSDKVQLVLDGAEITSSDSAAIYCKTADKVFLTTLEGTQNLLANGGSYTSTEEANIDGAIYSKTDLTLNGSGQLTVKAEAGHGIVSKDELVITGGSYTIQAARHGMTGKDCISIAGGSFDITAGEDGIHAKNDEDASAGFLYINGGSFTIEAEQDALSATGPLEIVQGSFALTTGGGSTAGTMRPSDAQGGFGRRDAVQTTSETEESAKGIKSDGDITIQGGSFLLDCADDGVHSGGTVTISGGEWEIRTADDGIHADADVVIRGGDFSIPYCYEGVEGLNVTIDGGSFDIVSTDDGINAAGGMDGSGFGGKAPSGGNNTVTVNGGTITVVSGGDSIDSNGSIVLNGGTLRLTCNGNGNTALDCDGSYANNGASVTTNDGSENGGGFGFRGGMNGSRPDMGGNKPEGSRKERPADAPRSSPGGVDYSA